jgi:hypothetical protein
MPEDGSSDPHHDDLTRITTIVLAEFAALRSEIVTRINLQVTLILGYLTVTGVVLSIALSRPDNRTFILLLPIVTPWISLLFLEQLRQLNYLGEYITRYIRPQLQVDGVDSVKVFRWEWWIARRQYSLSLVPYLAMLSLQLLGVPIGVLIYAILYHAHDPKVQVNTLERLLWWLGAFLTAGLIFYIVDYGVYAVRPSRGSNKVGSSAEDRGAEGVQDQADPESA